jgi:hypothetical protein|eukprot:COSAG06_NODE_4753_length_3983_cov_8.210681_2_plen_194_part_00
MVLKNPKLCAGGAWVNVYFQRKELHYLTCLFFNGAPIADLANTILMLLTVSCGRGVLGVSGVLLLLFAAFAHQKNLCTGDSQTTTKPRPADKGGFDIVATLNCCCGWRCQCRKFTSSLPMLRDLWARVDRLLHVDRERTGQQGHRGDKGGCSLRDGSTGRRRDKRQPGPGLSAGTGRGGVDVSPRVSPSRLNL